MDIISRITALRNERGWSINRLAKMSGLSQSTISNLYNRNYEPTFATLESICTGFGITLAEFFSIGTEATFLSEEQKKILVEWSKLSPEQKISLYELIKNML